jgi:hypothetical protein
MDMDIEKVKKYAAEIATIISCSDLEIKQFQNYTR